MTPDERQAILSDLARVKIAFQLRAIGTVMGLRDSNSDPQGENAGTAVECGASQSGVAISDASPEPSGLSVEVVGCLTKEDECGK